MSSPPPPPSTCWGKNRHRWLRCNWAGPIKLVQELFLNAVVRDIHSEFTLILWWKTSCYFSVFLQQGQIIYKLLLWCHQFLLKLQQLQYWSERFTNAAREAWVTFPFTAEPRSENRCVQNAFYFRILRQRWKDWKRFSFICCHLALEINFLMAAPELLSSEPWGRLNFKQIGVGLYYRSGLPHFYFQDCTLCITVGNPI